VSQEDGIDLAGSNTRPCEALVCASSDIEQERLAACLNQDARTKSLNSRNRRSGAKKCHRDLLTTNVLRYNAREQRNGCDQRALNVGHQSLL
jgi:hypothetical protein